MSLEICYVLPAGEDHLAMAYRFVSSYCEHSPACEHSTIILTDPGYENEAEELCCLLPNLKVVATPDHARDLSRYEAWVKQSGADCCMFFGGSSYLRRDGWGLRAFRAFQDMGAMNLYGSCGHTGAGPVRPHLRTTGFWGSPALLRRYPNWPRDVNGRYTCEHGAGCLSDWVRQQGGQCWVINFGSAHTLDNANADPGGYARGNQSNLLCGDKLTMPPYQPWP